MLKLTSTDEPVDPWQARLTVQRAAASAGMAPAVVHVDEARRAVLSALVVDRSWPAQYGNPATRAEAIRMLGRMLAQRAHLPTPPGMGRADVRQVLQMMWGALTGLAEAAGLCPRGTHAVAGGAAGAGGCLRDEPQRREPLEPGLRRDARTAARLGHRRAERSALRPRDGGDVLPDG
ncbi:MAG: hypothetical protein V9E87_16660 [Gemmatimonadales bacterium]